MRHQNIFMLSDCPKFSSSFSARNIFFHPLQCKFLWLKIKKERSLCIWTANSFQEIDINVPNFFVYATTFRSHKQCLNRHGWKFTFRFHIHIKKSLKLQHSSSLFESVTIERSRAVKKREKPPPLLLTFITFQGGGKKFQGEVFGFSSSSPSAGFLVFA